MTLCFVCEGETDLQYSVEAYEDLLVTGSRFYQPVCPRCFYLAIGYCSQNAGAIPIHELRNVIQEAPEAQFIKSIIASMHQQHKQINSEANRISRLLGVV